MKGGGTTLLGSSMAPAACASYIFLFICRTVHNLYNKSRKFTVVCSFFCYQSFRTPVPAKKQQLNSVVNCDETHCSVLDNSLGLQIVYVTYHINKIHITPPLFSMVAEQGGI